MVSGKLCRCTVVNQDMQPPTILAGDHLRANADDISTELIAVIATQAPLGGFTGGLRGCSTIPLCSSFSRCNANSLTTHCMMINITCGQSKTIKVCCCDSGWLKLGLNCSQQLRVWGADTGVLPNAHEYKYLRTRVMNGLNLGEA